MIPSGYSGTPLAKKLGIKKNFRVSIINQPANYYELFTDLPDSLVHDDDRNTKRISFIIL